jgi:hypothetical protein
MMRLLTQQLRRGEDARGEISPELEQRLREWVFVIYLNGACAAFGVRVYLINYLFIGLSCKAFNLHREREERRMVSFSVLLVYQSQSFCTLAYHCSLY